MTKEQLVKAIETTMLNDIQKKFSDSPLAGTPLESVALMEIMNKSKDDCKEFMIKRIGIGNAPTTEEEIESILNEAYTNVYNHIFE